MIARRTFGALRSAAPLASRSRGFKTAQEPEPAQRNYYAWAGAGAASVAAGGWIANTVLCEEVKCETSVSPYSGRKLAMSEVPDLKPQMLQHCIVKPVQPDKPTPDRTKLPTLTLEEVRRDRDDDHTIVTWNGGVYDVTEFLEVHPGGEHRIRMAHGQDLAAFWDVYKLHHRHHIQDLLEQYRVGNLSKADALRAAKESECGDYYNDDPVRTAKDQLRIPSEHPWNSEPQFDVLTQTYLTPNDQFFVRNHNAVPVVDEKEFRLEIDANPDAGCKATSFSLDDLKKLPRKTIVSTIQCAGNRQEDFITRDRALYVAPHWRGRAIGNAAWTGVPLREVLRASGMDVDAMSLGTKYYPEAKVVNFVGLDHDETGVNYAGIIPIEKAIDPFGDALLAYEMNGETLPRDHGYPIRLVCPGHAGCRNVKWVNQIFTSAKPSELDAGAKLDRHFAPDQSFENHIRMGDDHLRLDQSPAIQTAPVQSIICSPLDGATMPGAGTKTMTVSGLAYTGGGRGIVRVEVSIDGGKNFFAAELRPEPSLEQASRELKAVQGRRAGTPMTFPVHEEAPIEAPPPNFGMGRHWAWRQWDVTIELPEEMQAGLRRGKAADIEVCARAIDGDFNTQPAEMTECWNALGICISHWPRVNVHFDPKIKQGDTVPAPPKEPPAGYPKVRL